MRLSKPLQAKGGWRPEKRLTSWSMFEDQDVSLVADIAQRMGVASNYASQYRARMVEQGIIDTRGRGKVAFDMPHFKEFLLSKFAEA